MPPLQLDHIALQVFDAQASYRFYRDVLQLPLLDALSGDDWDSHPWLMMIFRLADGRQLVLCALRGAAKAPVRSATDLPHLSFGVASHGELHAWELRLRAENVAVRQEQHDETQRSIYFEDPDGFTIEITAPLSATWENNPGASAVVEAWLAQEPRER